MEKLEEELDAIEDIDMSAFGFAIADDDDEEEDEEGPYSDKTNVPQYDVTGDVPDLSELVDGEKVKELIQEIDDSSLSFEQKRFLRTAAQRHNVFNYKKIAEYYAAASEEMQELMEKSALVIIDYQDAIMNGYTKLSEKIQRLMREDAKQK